jgi:hypothetical protein
MRGTDVKSDHILIDIRHGSNIMDVRSMHRTDVGSDHILIDIRHGSNIMELANKRKQTKFL